MKTNWSVVENNTKKELSRIKRITKAWKRKYKPTSDKISIVSTFENYPPRIILEIFIGSANRGLEVFDQDMPYTSKPTSKQMDSVSDFLGMVFTDDCMLVKITGNGGYLKYKIWMKPDKNKRNA